MKLHRTHDWYEELGDVLFFHFENDEEPPTVLLSCPGSSDWDENGEDFWTHYLVIDLNSIFNQVV